MGIIPRSKAVQASEYARFILGITPIKNTVTPQQRKCNERLRRLVQAQRKARVAS